jgi:hypothetical protein
VAPLDDDRPPFCGRIASRSAGLLARLLGPVGQQLSCEECFDQLARFVELDVSGPDPDTPVPVMRAHLEGCSACREDHDSLRALLDPESMPPPR